VCSPSTYAERDVRPFVRWSPITRKGSMQPNYEDCRELTRISRVFTGGNFRKMKNLQKAIFEPHLGNANASGGVLFLPPIKWSPAKLSYPIVGMTRAGHERKPTGIRSGLRENVTGCLRQRRGPDGKPHLASTLLTAVLPTRTAEQQWTLNFR
jgi:hypothetical protein